MFVNLRAKINSKQFHAKNTVSTQTILELFIVVEQRRKKERQTIMALSVLQALALSCFP